jgi:hypothetical protein
MNLPWFDSFEDKFDQGIELTVESFLACDSSAWTRDRAEAALKYLRLTPSHVRRKAREEAFARAKTRAEWKEELRELQEIDLPY